MTAVEESIYIGKPVEDVWEFMQDFEKTPLWFSSIETFELIGDEPLQKGSRIKDVSRILGKRIEAVDEVLELDVHNHIAFRTVEAPFPQEWEFRYEPEGAGTRLSFHGKAEGFGGFFGRLADPLVTKLFRHEIVGAMAKLKTLLEE